VISLANLIADRFGSVLTAGDALEIDVALSAALNAEERGNVAKWKNSQSGDNGEVRLDRRDKVGADEVCAVLHHVTQLRNRTIRGSVRLCRIGSDSWFVDTVTWRRTGGDLVQNISSKPVIFGET
jgi:hypothetical protein